MSGPEFFRTVMGSRFYEVQVPRIASALENIASELKRANDLTEQTQLTRKTNEGKNDDT